MATETKEEKKEKKVPHGSALHPRVEGMDEDEIKRRAPNHAKQVKEIEGVRYEPEG